MRGLAASALLAAPASAGNPETSTADQPDNPCDRYWDWVKLYDDPDNACFQSFVLSGRLQVDAAFFENHRNDENYDQLLWRRFRFGFKTGLYEDWTIHVEGDFALDEEGFGETYTGLTEAYIGYKPGDEISLKALKHSAGFTLDGATSSKELLTPERNNLTNNLWYTDEYFTGLSASGTVDKHWHYRLGVFSGDDAQELSEFEFGYFGLASIGYDFATGLGCDEALLRFDYVYSENNDSGGLRDFRHILSLSSQFQSGRWGCRTDLGWGVGFTGQEDVHGLVVMPFYDVTNCVQLVARYTYLGCSGDNGLRLNRYENRTTAGRGDRYEEFFAGINYYVNSHKLKWQLGIQHAEMDDAPRDGGDYAGWGLTAALRLYW